MFTIDQYKNNCTFPRRKSRFCLSDKLLETVWIPTQELPESENNVQVFRLFCRFVRIVGLTVWRPRALLPISGRY
jgi:hypothetical protein